ncbi:hypothetical protein V2J09_015007 [Rumex salicifolius]
MAVSSPWGMIRISPITQSTFSYLYSDCFPKKSLLNCRPYPSTRRVSRSVNGGARYSSVLCCRCNLNGGEGASAASEVSGSDWDWNRWTRYFSEIEQAESYASILKFQLEDAIEKEDFQEAAKLKVAIAESASKDAVAEIMSNLKRAISEERYLDASKLTKSTGSGLVGWWVGYSKDSDDPFGRLVHITPSLVSGSPGTPLFEIYVVKDSSNVYLMKVAFLHRSRRKSNNSAILQPKPVRKQSSSESESESLVDIQSNDDKAEKQEKGLSIEETAEGIKSVINFLKDKIPGLNFKLMDVDVMDVDIAEESESLRQLIQDDDEETDEDSEDESNMNELQNLQSGRVVVEDNGDITDDENDLGVKVFIGGVLHNNEDAPPKDEFVRLPAEIKGVGKDSFLLHVPGARESEDSNLSNVKVAAVMSQGASDLMPPDVAKVFIGSDKVSSKASRDVREIVKLAVNQAQKRNNLSELTTFNRITTSKGNLDPFEGLYVGSFGPYGTEVVQLRRKFGHWNSGKSSENSADVEFFEYVEAVKLTGDLNVPAGQVTFRAKIGKGSRVSNRGMYPDELGVLASFKGQGRIAEFGFRNPQWVEGELLQLNGKGIGPYARGSDLGFLYVVPEQSFLVLFNRLILPEGNSRVVNEE